MRIVRSLDPLQALFLSKFSQKYLPNTELFCQFLSKYQQNHSIQFSQTHPYPSKPPLTYTSSMHKPSSSNIKSQSHRHTCDCPTLATSSTTLPTNTSNRNTSRPCYKCGERYFPWHQCKFKTVMAVHGGGLDDNGEEVWHEAPKVMEQWEQLKKAALSIHAVEGIHEMETIKMLGVYKNGQLVILVDSGSPNSL